MGSGSGTNRGVPGKSGKNSELPLLRVSYRVSSKPTLETIWYYVSNIHLSAGTLLGVLWRLVQGSGLQVPEPRHRGWEWGRGGQVHLLRTGCWLTALRRLGSALPSFKAVIKTKSGEQTPKILNETEGP